MSRHMYCVRCHAGKTVVAQSPVIMRNGTLAMRGRCKTCASLTYRIVSKAELSREKEKHWWVLGFVIAFGIGLGAGVFMVYWV